MSWTVAYGIGRPVASSTTTKVQLMNVEAVYSRFGSNATKRGASAIGSSRSVRSLNVNRRPGSVRRR